MEELLELKRFLLSGNISDALLLVEEMTEMSKDDKINKIYSFAKILLMHLIKQRAENRTTRSWDLSIKNSVREIQRTNQRRKAKGNYCEPSELRETIEEAYDIALDAAAGEAFEGKYESAELGVMVDRDRIIQEAIALVSGGDV
ncbi:MAG: DUF29 family protein [Pseudanabaena sp.]|jgi:hypothetical protein|nr:DUF29 family protein [Pseudanabaena sp. M090S1SP2A07QC]MCA6507764.1 DUF29 family protein [Pseudanabaena sp. M172S2SP2A07QC]MCA6510781.1 DUF29 family protein [Pseudanabaena sp. M109S1SP2A07QC]MCA6517838.1 DUF29 family protein [Pseudanabaena sp. M110S1SP2A07QC]MCA6521610.1 DUF29 family protein [Pseudanabaena sp. M051S1SP2A07QC]MCA6524888.1 DUF29 family protein [Pseudanabaena sp. M179S2SP2A07QC]MCA6530447.1 DUF29 family protein [Pseudanabaena sp. M125S2SP2A07QC]MCA6534998.1 DUF29 family prot